ncbi:MAG: hypothetical protein K8S23_06610 [Candidatus Cloacimonetes bacterium]|nr:hypothetical protein [Candidatus Cloacimonadota bacterium]
MFALNSALIILTYLGFRIYAKFLPEGADSSELFFISYMSLLLFSWFAIPYIGICIIGLFIDTKLKILYYIATGIIILAIIFNLMFFFSNSLS